MNDAGAIILAFGSVFTLMGIKQKLSVGSVQGAAGPVMVVVGAILLMS